MKIVCAQISSSTNKEINIKKACSSITEAKELGADLIMLPEMFMCDTSASTGLSPKKVAEPLNGPFVKALQNLAKKNDIYVICGVYESSPKNESVYNSVVVIDKNGKLISTYKKTHLCDSWNVRESELFKAGTKPFTIINTEFGKIGLLVCYELRFPEISRYLAFNDIDILLIPAAWYTGALKEEHWEILLRARAIENTVFVCASNQTSSIFSGRSMIIDPMGIIMASAGEEEQLIVADLQLDRLKRAREKNPCLNNIVNDLFANKKHLNIGGV